MHTERSPWRRRLRIALAVALVFALHADAVVPRDWAPRPGEFVWRPAIAPAGPLVAVVSLQLQQVHVYRNGVRIGASTISSGKPGHETPVGVFTILQKRAEHYSNLYDNAPMPWMQRLTWDGVALHAGRLPGHPASHGCIRLPDPFARAFFAATRVGDVVVVTDGPDTPGVVIAGAVVRRMGGAAAPGTGDFWAPERAASGPLAVVVSTSDRRMVVTRAGVRIAQAAIRAAPDLALGTRAYVLLRGVGDRPGPVLPDGAARRWMAVDLGRTDDGAAVRAAFESGRIAIPREIARKVDDLLRPGDTVVITDAALEGGLHPEQLELEADGG